MELTKFAHACAVLAQNGECLVIDPGVYSPDFTPPENVVAIIITHVHPDHFDMAQLDKIFAGSPSAEIFTTQEVADTLPDPRRVTVAQPGQTFTIGSFELESFGGEHAMIHDSYPRAQNIGVLINNQLYYPGDSLVEPNKPVAVLLAPAGAPWLKIGEAIDFVGHVKPTQLVIPTHDAVLSERGQQLADNMLSAATQSNGARYQRLQSGESIKL